MVLSDDLGRIRGALLFRPRIVLGACISDAPSRRRTHADWPAHLGSHHHHAADFRYRSVDKLTLPPEGLQSSFKSATNI